MQPNPANMDSGLAVVSPVATVLRFPNGRELARPTSDLHALHDALELALRHHLRQVWVMPGVGIVTDQGELDALPALGGAGGWSVSGQRPKAPPTPGDAWYLGFRKGVYCPDGYSVVFPGRDPRNPFASADSGRTLLNALLAYWRAVGLPYQRSPQATAARLVRAAHHGNLATHLDTPGVTPPPGLYGNGALLQDAPFMWRRTPTEHELDSFPFFVSGDVNAQFLRAMNGLALGFGEPEYRERPGLPDDAKKNLLPGYYRVRAGIEYGDEPLPGLLYRRGHEGRPYDDEGVWVSAPTLDMWRKEGQGALNVLEAWTYPMSHRFLEPTYTTLVEARRTLMAAPTEDASAALALDAVKLTYTRFVGSLGMRMREDTDALKRPDWRHAIQAHARALHWRALHTAAQAQGIYPHLVTEDTAGYLTPAEAADDPAGMLGFIGLKISRIPGQYKVKDAVDMREWPDLRAVLLDPRSEATDWQRALVAVRKAQRAAKGETEHV